MVYSTRRFVLCLTLCRFVLVFFSPFSIVITLLWVDRANLTAYRTFARSVLSPLLFIILREALSREFRSGVRWENLHADDLVIIAESLEEYVRRLLTWKEAMDKK